jgi:hypothetical protein
VSRLGRIRAFLAVLLFEPGAGWLRWGLGVRVSVGSQAYPPDYGTIAPPARRAWVMVEDFVGGWSGESAWSYLKDPDRGTDLRLFARRIIAR